MRFFTKHHIIGTTWHCKDVGNSYENHLSFHNDNNINNDNDNNINNNNINNTNINNNNDNNNQHTSGRHMLWTGWPQ